MKCITFDDFHNSVYCIAFPIFKKYRVPGTVFVNGANLDLLAIKELKEMQGAGWEVSSHGMNHKRLPMLTAREIRLELEENIDLLRANGFTGKGLAYPWGMYTNSVIDIVKEYHTYARATVATRHSHHEEKYHIRSTVLSCKTMLESAVNSENNFYHGHHISYAINSHSWSPDCLRLLIKALKHKGERLMTGGEFHRCKNTV